ncbi:hypothetical protein VTO42DRAFT_3750 [Malbranchea cinnamomea]
MGRLREAYVLPTLVLLSALSSAVTLDCSHLQDDGQSWDLSALDGPHSVYHAVSNNLTIHNTTYTLDICKPLKDTECKTGTYVCGAVTIIPKDGTGFPDAYIPIAGNFINYNGRTLDPTITRLKKIDSEREGVRLELHGGNHPFDDKKGEKQQAVIDFVCDPERTGLEGEDNQKRKFKRDDEDGSDESDGNNDSNEETDDSKSLRFISYGHEDGTDSDVLRLEWLTKYACEGYEGDDGNKSSHWGFFTWLIILLFLCASAYLIFGSWLNYNRYGARGWDMLPHGDTLRDLPYLLRDWGRRVVNTIQGPGSRGGYSAV